MCGSDYNRSYESDLRSSEWFHIPGVLLFPEIPTSDSTIPYSLYRPQAIPPRADSRLWFLGHVLEGPQSSLPEVNQSIGYIVIDGN